MKGEPGLVDGPLFDDQEEAEYHWELGQNVRHVGLWRRERTYEFPIYQNTRGMAVFNASSAGDRNTETHDPTAAFWHALDELQQLDGDGDQRIDVDGCEWYEVEFIDELFGFLAGGDADSAPVEIGQLFNYATSQGGDE